MKLDKGSDFELSGKHFCSEEHARQFAQRMDAPKRTDAATTSHHEEGSHCGGCA